MIENQGLPVALGTAKMGVGIPTQEAFQILDKYASMGGRILDTSNNYTFWEQPERGGSEMTIGRWMAERGNRAQFTVMTKIGSYPAKFEQGEITKEGLSAEVVKSTVEKSLNRLQTDYIDILLAHHDDKSTPLLETWQAFRGPSHSPSKRYGTRLKSC